MNEKRQENGAEGPKVAIVMGSRNDWPSLQEACLPLKIMDIPYVAKVVSAHRTLNRLFVFAKNAENQGYQVIIAGAGGAAHLPGMVASMTPLPVIGVPIQSKTLNGIDSLLSIVQMPRGVAVATQAIGSAGAYNAGLMASQIIALNNTQVRERLLQFREKQTAETAEELSECV